MAASVKPSVEEAMLDDPHEINVTLSCRDSAIPERRLVLSRSLPIVRIGRSSKVHHKGFVPASDNAWFDNPVMSRQHAEILARFDDTGLAGVYLRDVASFHGTFHTPNNGLHTERRITPNELVKLANGDIIQFGMEILRTNKTYPPCYVDFLMEETTHKERGDSPRAFTVPDDVDDEEDDGDSENEDDLAIMDIVTKPTTAAFKSVKPWLTPNQRSRPPPIDLTVDVDNLPAPIAKFPRTYAINNNMGSEIIDLTYEVTHEPDNELYTAGPIAPPPTCVDLSSPAPISREDPLVFGSCRTLNRTGVAQSPAPYISPEALSDWYDEESEVNLYSESESAPYPESLGETSESGEIDRPLSIDDAESELGNYGDSDNIEEQSDSLSDADADIHCHDDGRSYASDDEREMDEVNALIGLPHNDAPPALASSFSHTVPPYAMTDIPALSDPTSGVRGSSLKRLNIYNVSHNREPSPSDAALFKCLPCFSHVPDDNRAKQLGEKSGKFEFFAAREENRAVVNQHHNTIPTSAIRETLFVNQLDTQLTPMSDISSAPSPSTSCGPDASAMVSDIDEKAQSEIEAPDAFSIKLDDSTVNQSSAWGSSGDRFINNPSEDEQLSSRVESVDFDMTSAYKFQQSKLAAEAQTLSKSRCLHIQDLLAQEPREHSSENQQIPDSPLFETVRASSVLTANKRSYDEAFNEPEDDITCEHPGSNTAIFSSEVSKGGDQKDSPVVNGDLPDATAMDGVQQSPSVPDSASTAQSRVIRPAKKIRFAQAIACVALGGAATFSYLVNTAPIL